jgi:hypothetical protein
VLLFVTPEEIEILARTLEAGLHRDPTRPAMSDAERKARRAEECPEAELVRVAAYAGLRQGEMLVLPGRSACIGSRRARGRRPRHVPLGGATIAVVRGESPFAQPLPVAR